MAAGSRHDNAGGIVVAGGNVHHVGVRAAQRFIGHSAAVHGDIPQRHLISLINAADLAVSRILYGVAFVPSQQLDQQIIQRFRPRPHNNLPRRYRHSPKLVQILRDGPPQLRGAGGRRWPQEIGILLQYGLTHQLGPCGKGEILRRRGVCHKIHKPCRFLRLAGRFLRCYRCRQRLVDTHDIVTPLFHPADVPLGDQLLIGIFHRDHTDLQMSSQRSLAGQLLPCLQHTGENIFLYLAVKLFIQAHAAFFKGIGQHPFPPIWYAHFFYFWIF